MKADSGPLVRAYGAIEGLVGEVDVYVKVSGCETTGFIHLHSSFLIW